MARLLVFHFKLEIESNANSRQGLSSTMSIGLQTPIFSLYIYTTFTYMYVSTLVGFLELYINFSNEECHG